MRTFRRCLLISSAILIASFLAQSSFAQPQSPQTPFRKSVLDQLAKLTQFPESEWRFHTGDVSNGESASLDDSTWQSVKVGHRWNSGTAWFRRVLEIPRTVNGYDISGSTLRLEISASSDFQNPIIIYVNGSRVAMGESLEPIVIGERVQPGQKIVVAAKVLSPAESNRLNRATIRIEPPSSRVSPALSRDELAANESLVLALLKDKPESEQQLDAAFHAVAFTALERGDQAAFDASLREAHKRLEVFRPQWQNYSIRATGNSHIDMAWLWPWTETVEVARNTFRTALELMNEYPEYTFTQSTAQMSAWMEDKYPLLFREIQRRVA
ncbi:MAG: alpha-mannosidase, partial [Acidobacteria bacterium]|nr:alpha-mannosidase [Acidobacteriota bacterium]